MAYFTNTCKYTQYQYLTLSNANVIPTVQHGIQYHDAMLIRNQETEEKDTLIQNICPSSHVKCWKHRPFLRPHMKLCHY
jgi:hypothetical protein